MVADPRVTLDLSPLIGTWKNTNTASKGVVTLDIAAEGHELRVTANGWVSASAHAYSADGFESRQALAFNATFEHSDFDIRLQANIKAGVLVIAFLTRFHDDSGRSNNFVREFYYRSAK
jgi:hypothetical protein